MTAGTIPQTFLMALSALLLFQSSFQRFSDASGLQANPDKSSIYMSGVNQAVKQEILSIFVYMQGKFPSSTWVSVSPHTSKGSQLAIYVTSR